MLRFAPFLCLFAATALAATETFKDVNGQVWQGRISEVYGDFVLFGLKDGVFIKAIDRLDDASVLKVADYLANRPAAELAWNNSTSTLAKQLRKKLQVLQDGKLVAFDPGARAEPEFYLIYYGALWCGPCRKFSPKLVEAYQRLKPLGRDRFEVIFVSSDRDGREQLDYIREVGMPWPVVRFSQADGVPVFERWRANGIPALVVLTREGELIFHSYEGQEYLGAENPLKKFETLLASVLLADRPHAEGHRLAVAQHLRAAGGGDLKPKAYFASMPPGLAANMPEPVVKARLAIDAQGRVSDVVFTPELSAVAGDMLRRVVSEWLFLPAVAGGQARETSVVLPIKFDKQ